MLLTQLSDLFDINHVVIHNDRLYECLDPDYHEHKYRVILHDGDHYDYVEDEKLISELDELVDELTEKKKD